MNQETLLRIYTTWLLKHGYIDEEVWCEKDVVREFLDSVETKTGERLCQQDKI